MEKKNYQTPSMEVMTVNTNCTLLAGSTKTVEVGNETINNGYVDARPNRGFSLWDGEE